MRILITGGAGFIGSAVVPVLQADGHDIHVIDNLSFGNRDFINVADSNFYLVDIRDAKGIDKVFKSLEPEIVIHLAALHYIPYCNQHPYEAADVNIRGTINILNACRGLSDLKKIFFASTAAVYKIADVAVSEVDELLPVDIYGLSKLTGEYLCKEFWHDTKVDTIICRFFNAFGPNETNPHLIPEIENQLRNGLRNIKLGNLTPKRDFIHTYDMASAVKHLLKLQNVGYDTFNLGRGIEYSVIEIVEAFEKQLNETIKIEIDQSRVRKAEREHLLADISRIKSRTGWEPEWSIGDGIKNMIQSWNN